jgi:hypothetical protein
MRRRAHPAYELPSLGPARPLATSSIADFPALVGEDQRRCSNCPARKSKPCKPYSGRRLDYDMNRCSYPDREIINAFWCIQAVQQDECLRNVQHALARGVNWALSSTWIGVRKSPINRADGIPRVILRHGKTGPSVNTPQRPRRCRSHRQDLTGM